jgi:hypothetical protein
MQVMASKNGLLDENLQGEDNVFAGSMPGGSPWPAESANDTDAVYDTGAVWDNDLPQVRLCQTQHTCTTMGALIETSCFLDWRFRPACWSS